MDSKKKLLYIPVYPGELGWELINYIPHVNYISKKSSYDEIFISCRKGREGLYPMGTKYFPIELSDKKSCGNKGPNIPAIDITRPKELEAEYNVKIVNIKDVTKVKMHFQKKRDFIKYKASSEDLLKWSLIDSNSVVLCVRGRPHGSYKNWSDTRWIELCEHINNKGFKPVVTGSLEEVNPKLPDYCLNLIGKTTVSDMIPILKKCKLAIGQSTGTLHLASLCGTPHAVWGTDRVKERYDKSWNPHNTLSLYHGCGNTFNIPVKHAKRLFDNMIKYMKTKGL